MADDNQHNEKIKEIILQDSLDSLCAALFDCETLTDMKNFLIDLSTPQERDALGERWTIAQLLNLGTLSYRDISGLTGASTTTIGRVARFLDKEPHKGYAKALAQKAGSA